MKSLILHILLTVLLIGEAHSQTIHAILVADSKDEKVGNATRHDIDHMMQFLENASRATGYALKPQIIEPKYSLLFGLNYDVPEITSIILGLDVKPNDVFFFYYSGHGSKSFNDDDPFARPHIQGYEHKYLSLGMVQKLAQISEPRLSIVMGNLCNVFSINEDDNKGGSGYIDWLDESHLSNSSLKLIKSLFNEKGQITSTSSKRGTLSFVQRDGGIFTKLFINSFYEFVSTKTSCSWEDIFVKTKTISEETRGITPYYELELSDI